jgi:hypothetical protein
MPQTSITNYRNNNLFSNYYLDTYLKKSPEWKKDDHITAFEQIKKIYYRESKLLEKYLEGQLREHFFNDIFAILGFEYEVTETTQARKFPDYAFFFDRKSLDDAHKNKDTISFFTNAIALGEVKQWKVDLDKIGRSEHNHTEHPSRQIWDYLEDTEKKWGILSNGRIWRLYTKYRHRDNYLEIDLSSIITTNDTETFKIFYYFFRKNAFLPSKDGPPFLDRILKGSIDYATNIGDSLKDNVYWAMKRIAEGFIDRGSNHLDKNDPATLVRVQNNTMILLYRFLFLLYAEGKGLLDLNDQRYLHYYSFYHVTRDIAEKQDGPADERYDALKISLLTELKVLFDIVNRGSEDFGITRDICYVPAYNGGLFDPDKHQDLEHWEIGDQYLADAIDLLSRSELKDGHRDFVDYSTLEIRHLGSIYEGLLEYKLRVAESDLVVSDRGWVTLAEYNANRKQKKAFTDFDENDRVSASHLYLATEKGERKSTGSYYTPDYIVNYIVKNTIEPVVEEKWKEVQEKNASYIDATLSVNVLDPAMGSGHFLVGAVDFLSQKLMEAVGKDFEAEKIADTAPYTNDWARRDVVSHCIYGVDLNELAVELAKVALWLTSISRDKPLSFLDHRLKKGNSLIGSRITDLAWYHDGERKSDPHSSQKPIVSPVFVEKILNKISEIEKIGDDKLDDIKKKEKVFSELQNIPEYQKVLQIADLHTSFYFGNKIEKISNTLPSSYYYNLIGSLYGNETEWKSRSKYPWFKKALEMRREKSFFHWELEFPEIFFDAGKLRENPGWDAVIGNPPYGSIEGELVKSYIKKHYSTSQYQLDKYVAFIEKTRKLSRLDGYQSLIIPSSYLSMHFFSLVRRFMLDECQLNTIILFKYPVFDDPTVESSIYVSQSRSFELISSEHQVDCIIANNINQFLLHEYETQKIAQSFFKHMPEYDFCIEIEPKDFKLIQKLKQPKNLELKDICDLNVGIKPYQTGKGKPPQTKDTISQRVFDGTYKKNSTYHRYLMGKDINRYEINPLEERWISYGEWLAEPRPSAPFFEPKKILIRQTSDTIIASLDKEQYLTLNNIHNLKMKQISLSYEFLLTILNSKISTYFHQKIVPEVDRVFAEVKIVDLEVQPIPKIYFTTPVERRTTLVDEAKGMYQSFTQSTDSQPLLAFVDARLAAQPEESDVVHDLLAFLAEEMVKMNKANNAEIKAFLKFVESEIGTSVDSLSNKTAIQEYYDPKHNFTKFIDILVENQKNLKKGYNPKNRKNRGNLEEWYMDSCGKLKPLLTKIDATDALINQIVYKLYGLSEDEIRIVEGA